MTYAELTVNGKVEANNAHVTKKTDTDDDEEHTRKHSPPCETSGRLKKLLGKPYFLEDFYH